MNNDTKLNIAENCGMMPGKLNMICGASGSGKSLYLQNLVKEAMESGKKVICVNFDSKSFHSTYEFSFPLGTSMKEISDCVRAIKLKDMIVIDGIHYVPYQKNDELHKLAIYCAENNITLMLTQSINNLGAKEPMVFGSSRIPALANSIVKVKLNREKTKMTVDVIKNKFSNFLKRVVLKADLEKGKIEC